MSDKTISLRISPDFDRKVRVEAAKNDMDRSTFIREALAEKLVETRTQYEEEPKDDN